MKKRKASKNPDSPFWKPNPGETLSGVFKEFTKTKPYNEGDPQQVAIVIGEKILTCNSSLIKAFRQGNLKSGKTKISVTFLGQNVKGKRKFNNYAVTIDGKEIEMNTFEKLTAEEAFDYFDSLPKKKQ